MEEKLSALKALEDERTLNPNFVRNEDERPKVAYNQFSDVPVISLSGIDDAGKRSTICEKIAEAFEDLGVFQVVDHGVDLNLVADMIRLSKEFFDLPPEEKLRYDMTGNKKGGFLVSTHLKGEGVENFREFMVCLSYPERDRDYSRWPDKPEGWRKVTEQYSEKLMDLARKILGLLSEAMGLDSDAIARACIEMDQKLVINHYPKCPQPDLALGLKRHTDPGIITLLYQDMVGGFQATRDGGKTWVTVKPIQDAFVVNLGDYGHYLSNGRFRSADHQAVVNSECSRMSIATFQNPVPEAKVYPLAIREGEKPIVDEAITFTEMYRRKMIEHIEVTRVKHLPKDQQQMQDKFESKPLEDILA